MPLYPIGIGTWILVLCLCFSAGSLSGQPIPYEDPVPRNRPIQSIAFGSCLRQDRPAPVLDQILSKKPDVFIFLGDNVYADTESASRMKDAYSLLGTRPQFQKLRNQSRIHAIWDDHDYGANDAGASFPFRLGSEKIFKSFWGLSGSKPYENREGIYAAFLYRTGGANPIKIQFILLDTRSFRSPWNTKPWWHFFGTDLDGPYIPDSDPDKTMLGPAQWKWLEYQFQVQADVRIVASSIQVLSAANGFETWSNFPHERTRILKLARSSQGTTVFLSGDRHFAEISALRFENKTFYDVTASSLNQPLDFGEEKNPLRLGSRYADSNFGFIRIDDSKPRWSVTMEILDLQGRAQVSQTLTEP